MTKLEIEELSTRAKALDKEEIGVILDNIPFEYIFERVLREVNGTRAYLMNEIEKMEKVKNILGC